MTIVYDFFNFIYVKLGKMLDSLAIMLIVTSEYHNMIVKETKL